LPSRAREIEKSLSRTIEAVATIPAAPAVVSIVRRERHGQDHDQAPSSRIIFRHRKIRAVAACDTFRAAANRAVKLWGARLKIEVIASAYGADAASVAHDAAPPRRRARRNYLFIGHGGRCTRNTTDAGVQKLHRVIGKQLRARRTKCCWCWTRRRHDALNQAREFNNGVPLTGLILTSSTHEQSGMVVGDPKELGLPIKFIGLGEQAGRFATSTRNNSRRRCLRNEI